MPGLRLAALFFLVPTVHAGRQQLYDPAGRSSTGYAMTWHFGNYTDALARVPGHLVRSFIYAGIATVACLLLGFPLAYAIAFKAGRWQNLMLVLVIAPFFTSFLMRTLSWKLILADNGLVVDQRLQTIAVLPDDGRLLATPVAVIAGLTYNFLPFMVLPLYASLEKIDPRLVEAASDLYAIAVHRFRMVTCRWRLPGRGGRHAAHLHPGLPATTSTPSCSGTPHRA